MEGLWPQALALVVGEKTIAWLHSRSTHGVLCAPARGTRCKHQLWYERWRHRKVRELLRGWKNEIQTGKCKIPSLWKHCIGNKSRKENGRKEGGSDKLIFSKYKICLQFP